MDNLIYTEKKIFKHKPLILSLTPSTGERRKKLHNKKLKMGVIVPLYHLNLNPRRNFTTIHSHQNVAEIPYSPPSSCSSSDSKLKPVNSVKASHAQIIKMMKERDSDIKVHSLVTSYLKSGDFHSAAKVFLVGFEKNYLYWIAFWEDFRDFGGDPYEILEVFVEFHNMGVTFENETLAMILKLCAELRVSWLGMEVHACLIKRGFELNQYSKSALLNFFGSCLGLDSAYKLLEESSDQASFLWNEAVLVALKNQNWFQALNFFRKMQLALRNVNNALIVSRILQACAKLGALEEGKQIHSYTIRNAMESDSSICNSLIQMYSTNDNLKLAKAVFDLMENRNLTTWNLIIFGLVRHGHLKNAWELLHEMESYNLKPDMVTWNSLLSGNLHHRSYKEVLTILRCMQNAGLKPNSRSITSALQAVGELTYLNLGKVIHCYVVRNWLDSDPYVTTSLLDMYVKNRDLLSAQAVFDYTEEKNIVAWNSMISGYSFNGNFEKATSLMNQMEIEGIKPDLATYNSMISGYSMKGQYDEALHMIGQLKHSSLTPTVVTWTALISGSCQNGYYENAFNYCYQMQAEGVKPNSASVASLLRACSGLSLLKKGKEVHCLSVRNSCIEDAFVCKALIDMYSKCGDLKTAYIVFQKAKNKTLASWNSMIMGFSTYSHGKEAISLFQEMQEEKLDPDAITMTALLSGCKHSGLMDEGWKFFDKMEREYGITPTIQHYSCMVDLLGRAGYLDEAWDFIRQMPMEPDSTVWGAFLGSCRTHGNIELGEVAAKELFKLEPQNPANYILLMNMYASSQRWDDVDNIKDLMDHRLVKLGNVWSWIEINQTVNVFSALGKPHPEDGEVYFELYHLVSEIMSMGYVPDTKCLHQNIDEAEKEKMLLSHTEKRAIAYGLIKTKSNTPIRVIKNTTICADCHAFSEYTSLARKRQIILKDGIRFHHFVEGKCSFNAQCSQK